MILSRSRRKVSVDANVLMAAIAYKSKVTPQVLDRIRSRDELIVSNIILLQCTRQANKKNCRLDEDAIRRAVLEICPDVVMIEVIPLEELRRRYSIRDEGDLEVLYSADATHSDILITGDKDFYDENWPPRGAKVRFMRPREYLEEDEE